MRSTTPGGAGACPARWCAGAGSRARAKKRSTARRAGPGRATRATWSGCADGQSWSGRARRSARLWIMHVAAGTAFRQWYELGLAGHRRKAPGLPVGGRLLQALLAARYEVPPQVTAAERLTAEQQHARTRGGRRKHDLLARLKHQQLPG